MVRSRTATALAGLVVSLLASAAAWYYFDTFLLFLVVPFVPLLLRGRGGTDGRTDRPRECPECGFRTADPGFEYCPRDGAQLERTPRNGTSPG